MPVNKLIKYFKNIDFFNYLKEEFKYHEYFERFMVDFSNFYSDNIIKKSIINSSVPTKNIILIQTFMSITIIQKRSFSANVKASKRIGPHNKDVISVLIGSLLGNCSSNKLICSTRFIFRQNIKGKYFIF